VTLTGVIDERRYRSKASQGSLSGNAGTPDDPHLAFRTAGMGTVSIPSGARTHFAAPPDAFSGLRGLTGRSIEKSEEITKGTIPQ
jgi:hypothetical protein